MRKIYSSLNVTDAVLLKDELLSNGVEAQLLSKHGRHAMTAAAEVAAEVWIADEADTAETRGLIQGFLRRLQSAEREKRPWRCMRCKEENPDPFDSCWKCGRERRGT